MTVVEVGLDPVGVDEDVCAAHAVAPSRGLVSFLKVRYISQPRQ
jgi:hypothetical protein